MTKERLRKLLREHQEGVIKKDDLVTLLDYIALGQHDEWIDRSLAELQDEMREDPGLHIASEELYQRIISNPKFRTQPTFKSPYRYYRWAASIAALLIMAIGAWWFVSQRSELVKEKQHYTARTVTTAPTDRLLLKTSSGEIVDLDNVLTVETPTIPTVQFIDQTGLIYDKEGEDIAPEDHTIITPKGRQYHIVLSDGTKVWLNSATTITFPSRFDKKSREVILDGEAYFEVEKAAQWPFVVRAKSQDIEVLGTHFNVDSYHEDNITRTTLLEGKVSISSLAQKRILRPGQQASTTTSSSLLEVKNVDVADVLAWRDNLFTFNNDEIQQVMRQISRWYDIEVAYINGMEGKRIGGSIPRFENITELMDALQATGLLHYEMKGGTVIIRE